MLATVPRFHLQQTSSSMEPEKTASHKHEANFTIRLKVSYSALFASLFLTLTWSINVGITRKLLRNPNHVVPAISESSANQYQHPYYVLSMTVWSVRSAIT